MVLFLHLNLDLIPHFQGIPCIDTDEKELIPRRLRTQADLDKWKELDGASVVITPGGRDEGTE